VPIPKPNVDGIFMSQTISFQHGSVLVLHRKVLIFKTDLGQIDSTPNPARVYTGFLKSAAARPGPAV
jgi:hypothetical protein